MNWIEHFNKIKLGINPRVIKCCVCNDSLYFNDELTYADFGWHKLENEDRYVCHSCADHIYLTVAEAAKQDSQNMEMFGSTTILDPADNDTGVLMRELTWDEKQALNKVYADALKEFLSSD